MPTQPTPIARLHAVIPDRRANDPLVQVVRTYDRAIAACEAFDRGEASRHLRVLRAALDLDCPASRGFDALYAWCEKSLTAFDYIGPARCLRSLRSAWCRAVAPPPIVTRRDLPFS